MSFKVVVEQEAEEDMKGVVQWIAQYSQDKATLWYFDATEAIENLENFPARCPLAPESDRFGAEIRHLIFSKYRSRLIEKAGLRATVMVGLTLIQTPAGLDPEDVQIVGEAINARNDVVHNERRSVEITIARKYVSAIRRVIATFDKWVKGISE
jgi:hypothetical protein